MKNPAGQLCPLYTFPSCWIFRSKCQIPSVAIIDESMDEVCRDI